MAAGAATGVEAGFTDITKTLNTLISGAGGYLILIISIIIAAVTVSTQGNSKGVHQFSAWNRDSSGNNIPSKYNPGDKEYERAAYILDVVMGGYVPDFTEGATNYYSPAGMRNMVETGYQKNLIPLWLQAESAARDAPSVQIGGHIFTGQVKPKE